ncbi:TPA: hypothetical protein SCS24_003801 [Enterobacter kobei]|nr:hypothetical protein [Enterobacter kobei]HEG2023858.1 hypothetical protein [Enterobacter kobei]
MSTFTKGQLIAAACSRIDFAKQMLRENPLPLAKRKWEIELSLSEIALASLEADPVCVIDKANLDYLKSGSDADVWPASRTEMGDVLLYRAVVPAPVSLPDEVSWEDVPEEITEDDMALASAWAHGFNQCRAAMLQGAEPDFRETSNSSTKHFRENAETSTKCWCRTCRPVTFSDSRFVVCPECGNKRCPHANDHRNACSGSNEPGQEGSAYPAAPQQEVK